MGVKQSWQDIVGQMLGKPRPAPKPSDGERIISDSFAEAMNIAFKKMYLTNNAYLDANYLRSLATLAALNSHHIKHQNSEVIECSCGEYFMRQQYPGHIAEQV